MREVPIYSTTKEVASDRIASGKDLRPCGVILCGGHSSRMGTSKACLDFGGQSLLCRVIERLRPAVSSILVVAAPFQALPALPSDVRVVHDPTEGYGPLQGMVTGMRAIIGEADEIFLSACDVPFLRAEFVTLLATQREQSDYAMPIVDGRLYPLSAVYAVRILPVIEQMLQDRVLRMRSIAERTHGRLVESPVLRSVDPALESLINVNTSEEYAAAKVRAGSQPN